MGIRCFIKLLAAILILVFACAIVQAADPVAPPERCVDLSGTWCFKLDPKKEGIQQEWFKSQFPDQIKLPGTMDDAGLGPKNSKAPAFDGPYRLYNYAGPAWYQRDIDIPAAWQGQRVTLFLERCRWVTSVWLDDKFIDMQDSLITPHIHDLGVGVAPGRHRLTICVDNTVKIDLGVFVSALFGGTPGNMNGIVGRIELAATPPIWIQSVQVYPDVDKIQARVVVSIGNATGKAGHGTLRIGDKNVEAQWNADGGQAEVVLDMSGVKLWDEFSPNLQTVAVHLGDDQRTVTFGMRKFAARGTQFTLNNRPVFLRGTLECSIWPLTGYPPTDVPSWQRIFRIEKSYGLNYIRFHSWCPPEAAFAAADMEGIMIQAEGPMANVEAGTDSKRDAFVAAEFQRIVDTYGNHPSFCTMTLGNEYGGNGKLLTHWVDMLIKHDSRHLYSSASSAQKTGNRQWTEEPNGRGVHGPDTQRDLHAVVAGDGRPTIGHEIGQWTFFPDFNTAKKYTGVMRLKNFDLVRESLEKNQILDLAPQFVQATGKQAVLLYKEEIEVLLRTPGYAGFSLLDLHDYPTQGTALVGPLDEFWDSKGVVTPEAYRQFCNSTVPLPRLSKRTYTADETLDAAVDIAHYGPSDLANAIPLWNIKTETGQIIAEGALPAAKISTGQVTALGTLHAALASAAAPCKAIVTISLQGTPYTNQWDIWVYPAAAPTPPADVLLAHAWNEDVESALAAGKKVFLQIDGNLPHSHRGSFLPVFWSPVWFHSDPATMGILCNPQHPALAQFPTEFYSNWQWWDLIQGSRTLILTDTPASFRPIVQVIDNFSRNEKLGNLLEARVGKGRLLISTLNLTNHLEQHPAARQMLTSLYNYLASDKFQPTQELPIETLRNMLSQAKHD